MFLVLYFFVLAQCHSFQIVLHLFESSNGAIDIRLESIQQLGSFGGSLLI